MENIEDVQKVLDAYHSGRAEIIGRSKNGFPVIRYSDVTGYNTNKGAGFENQPTKIFIIKGTKNPSIVPTNLNWSTQ